MIEQMMATDETIGSLKASIAYWLDCALSGGSEVKNDESSEYWLAQWPKK